MKVTTFIFNFVIAAAAAAFLYGCGTVRSGEIRPPQDQPPPKASPTATPASTPPTRADGPAADQIRELIFQTVYPAYFDESSPCRKTYNEYFGKQDGFFSSDSPCTINLSFDKESGAAVKTLRIRRYDTRAKEYKIVENSIWKAQISAERYAALAKIVGENPAFADWKDAMVTVSNSKVTAKYPRETRTVFSNVDEKTVVFLKMLDAFRQLDKEIKWEKAE